MGASDKHLAVQFSHDQALHGNGVVIGPLQVFDPTVYGALLGLPVGFGVSWSHSAGETVAAANPPAVNPPAANRSEEHTSELQSRQYLVCRLLLEKKKSEEQ